MNNHGKVFVYVIALICGLLGFAFVYAILGWFFKPIESWVDNKTN